MNYFVCALIALLSVFARAELPQRYQLATHQQQYQFDHLLKELRCLVCQNEDLAESNAKLAEDLKGRIAAKIHQGETNAQIKHYLMERYGEFILFKPPLNTHTALLWGGPWLLLLVAVMVIWQFLRGQRQYD